MAVTVTDCAVAGAVSTPAEEIAPAEADQVTAFEKLLVPATAAVQSDVVPVCTGVWQETVTEVIEGAGAVTTTLAVPLLVGSCVLIAVTVTVPGVDGAVRAPLEIVPADALHVTEVLKLPVPVTEDVHVLV